MSVIRRNDRLPWSSTELASLRKLIALELPMRVIARKLHRSEEAVRDKAHRVAMSDMMRFTALPANRWTTVSGITK